MLSVPKLLQHAHTAFEHDFAQRVLISERRRVTIIAAMLAMLLVAGLFFYFLFGDRFGPAPELRFWLFLVLLIALFYELSTRFIFGLLARRDIVLPQLPRYANALIETSLPTIFLILLLGYMRPAEVLASPPSYAYFFFILLSILRLDFRLCLFTGAVAAVEFCGLVVFNVDKFPSLESTTFFSSVLVQFGKAILFIVGGVMAAFVARQVREGFISWINTMEERNRVTQLFGQHVSPAVVNKLLMQTDELESESRFVCLMFLDIRNFTAFSENKSPVEVITYLNTLFESMIDIINEHHGIINKFLGDGFMAVFGAPLSDGEDCHNAVAASLEILAMVEKLCQEGRIAPTRIGIGLHAGEAVTGNVGSALRKEYTIIGDTVNLASRIEQLNKQFSSQLLISDTVWQKMGINVTGAEALEPVHVKGRQAPVQIYKLA